MKTLRSLGYTETKEASGVSFHKDMDVEITLNVDDFLVVVAKKTTTGIEGGLEKVRKLKGKVLGLDEGDSK